MVDGLAGQDVLRDEAFVMFEILSDPMIHGHSNGRGVLGVSRWCFESIHISSIILKQFPRARTYERRGYQIGGIS